MRTNQGWMKDVAVSGKTVLRVVRVALAAVLVVGAGLTWTSAMAQTGGAGRDPGNGQGFDRGHYSRCDGDGKECWDGSRDDANFIVGRSL